MNFYRLYEAVKRKQYIGPPNRCDLCQEPIANMFIDGIVMIGGRSGWANVCKKCFDKHGVGLGPGRGQEYWRDPDDGNFYKIEG